MRLVIVCFTFFGVLITSLHAFAQSDDRFCRNYASEVSGIVENALKTNQGCLDFGRGVHNVYAMHYSWCLQNSRSSVNGAEQNIKRLVRQCTGGRARQSGNWIFCARENEFCDAPHGATVRYGANGTFAERRQVRAGVMCDNQSFGDPLYGVVKSCFYWSR
ncbi:hypothetical protein BSQ44_18630 [Aquibium oceanicum]|uniref:Uncharacterized protein n=1 Tax=Aquibium oceanicum TaxID=1670800 RepID=A0A1L3SUS3_9HYPH|nr:hypothetical protein BSQ44_18630 [Aquibium oceanicum]